MLNPHMSKPPAGEVGHVLFKYRGGWTPNKETFFPEMPSNSNFAQALLQAWI